MLGLNQPMSSPMIMRMFGLRPGAGACAGVGCCACAVWTAVADASADAASSELPLRRRSRRFSPLFCGAPSWAFPRE
jgi:hypothetical protein